MHAFQQEEEKLSARVLVLDSDLKAENIGRDRENGEDRGEGREGTDGKGGDGGGGEEQR